MNLETFNENNRDIIMTVFKIIMIYNALLSGWDIKKISTNTFEISKKVAIKERIKLDRIMREFLMIK